MPQLCPTIPAICHSIFRSTMPQLCPNYAPTMPRLCPARLCPIAPTMPQLCPNYDPTMPRVLPQLCPNYISPDYRFANIFIKSFNFIIINLTEIMIHVGYAHWQEYPLAGIQNTQWIFPPVGILDVYRNQTFMSIFCTYFGSRIKFFSLHLLINSFSL